MCAYTCLGEKLLHLDESILKPLHITVGLCKRLIPKRRSRSTYPLGGPRFYNRALQNNSLPRIVMTSYLGSLDIRTFLVIRDTVCASVIRHLPSIAWKPSHNSLDGLIKQTAEGAYSELFGMYV